MLSFVLKFGLVDEKTEENNIQNNIRFRLLLEIV